MQTTDDPTATATEASWVPAWDGAAYAANTGHHRVHDEWFLRAFPVRSADRVLDLGCGSGDFTRIVADLVPDGEVVGVDAQPTMLDEARTVAAANQSFALGPVQDLDRLFPASEGHDGTFDVVMSRSVLHWVPRADHPGVLRAAARVLRPGGCLRIECGGGGNVPTVVREMDAISAAFGGPSAPWNFTDAGTYLELLEAAGFALGDDGYVHTVAQRRAFDRESMIGWLQSQAIEAYAVGVPEDRRDAFRAAVVAHVDAFRRPDCSYDQTYVRLDLLARKPDA
jgi:trans-aconitate 2-methyltransferase